ncbi:MAG: threonylcarbamoyl-AMP synthase [Actinomycetia bacterium]|nr:threonylcarbamoyl-AMP synthase [Actinomycetes bacterium]
MDEIIINETDAPEETRAKKIRAVAEALISGRVLILPASTIYGISCRYDDRKALSRIYGIKRRKTNMPFIVLISDTFQLEMLAKDINITAKKLIKRYWETGDPRPLTLILKKSNDPAGHIAGTVPTIAVRMAGLKVLRDIIDQSGPIVSTSATISGASINPDTIGAIPSDICKKVDMVVRLKGVLRGKESTIVDITGEVPVLIREGAVSFESILRELQL